MSAVEKSSLLNQSQFAKSCGVSATTIRSYVDNHLIVPAKEVENRVFFTPDQVYDVKVLGVKRLINQSFLCVACEKDEATLKTVKEHMLLSILGNNPKAEAIQSLALSAKAMMEKPDAEPNEDVVRVIKSNVIFSFITEVKNVISSIICDVYSKEAFARSYTFDFFLSYICNHNPDSSLIDSYNKNDLSDVSSSLDYIKQRCEIQFTNIASRFGVYNVCNSTNFGILEAFNEDGSSLLKAAGFMFDSSSPNAKDIWDKTLGSNRDNSVTLGLTNICRNGFYTVIDGVDSLSDEVCSDIISKLASEEYKTVFVSSLEKLPKVIATSIDAFVKAGKIRVEYYQG